MRQRTVVTVVAAVALVVAGAGIWFWQGRDAELTAEELPGVSSVDASGTVPTVTFEPSISAKQLSAAGRKILELQGSGELPMSSPVKAKLGPVRFGFGKPRGISEELAAIVVSVAAVPAVDKALVGGTGGTVHVTTVAGKDVIPATQQVLQGLQGNGVRHGKVRLAVRDGDVGGDPAVWFRVESGAMADVSDARRRVDRIAEGLPEAGARATDVSVDRSFARMTAEVDDRSELLTAHRVLMESLGGRKDRLTLMAGDLRIGDLPQPGRLSVPLAGLLMLVDRLEATGAKVEHVAANRKVLDLSVDNGSQLERLGKQIRNVRDPGIPPDAYIRVMMGGRLVLEGAPEQVSARATEATDDLRGSGG